MSASCYHCNKPLSDKEFPSIGFRDTCPHCATDAHVCRNCSFYDEGAYHECREPQAEWVKDKERWNRCEYFRAAATASASDSKANALAALDDLFKE